MPEHFYAGMIPGSGSYCPSGVERFSNNNRIGTCTNSGYTSEYRCRAPAGVNQDLNGGGIANAIDCGSSRQSQQIDRDECACMRTLVCGCQQLQRSGNILCKFFQTSYSQLKQKYPSCYTIATQTFLDAWGCKGAQWLITGLSKKGQLDDYPKSGFGAAGMCHHTPGL